MTLEEKIAKFKDGDAGLYVSTQETWDKLLIELEKLKYRWESGTQPSNASNWWSKDACNMVTYNPSNNYMNWGSKRTFTMLRRTIIDVKEDDFIAEPSSVTIISTSGEEKHIRGTVTKKGNGYIIKETRILKFSVGDNFVSKEGVLGKVLDFSNKGEYYYRWIISENYYSLPLEQFEDIMSKVEW